MLPLPAYYPQKMESPTPCKKKAKMWIREIDEKASQTFPDVSCDSSLRSNIERKLHQGKSITDLDLDFDHILSQLPYRSILENMFSETDSEPVNLPIISKTYEESFMRQAKHDENQCVLGNMCECQFIDSCAPFIGVEFRLFNDPPKPQMCVLCSRRTTQKLFYDMCHTGKSPVGVIQRYGNIFGQPGEYATECMLACPQGFNLHHMPLPIMSHERNKYSVVTQGGLKYLQQHRVAFEHFAPPLGE